VKKVSLESTSCPFCVNSSSEHLFNVNGFKIVRCQRCGLIFLNPRPKDKDLTKFYPHDYYGKGGRIKRTLEKQLTRFSHFLRRAIILKIKKKGRILDFGCGTGAFIAKFSRNEWERFGVELNPMGYNLAKKDKDLKITNIDLKRTHFPDKYFDVITAFSVIEHTNNPKEIIAEFFRILKDDGILYLSTPNAGGIGFLISGKNWFHLDTPRHLYLFDRKVFKKAIAGSGFEILEERFPFWEYPLDYYHGLASNKSYFQKLLLIFFLPVMWLNKPIISWFKGGEIMEIIAKKRLMRVVLANS